MTRCTDMKTLPNQALEPTETSSCRRSIIEGASRVSPCLRGSVQRSIRMTRHASGWFGRLREPCCGYAAEEATVSGAHSGHGEKGPPMSRMIATAGPYRRSDLSAPISVIRSQKQSGSNQALEPTETGSCRGSILKGASQVTSCLRGSVQRWTSKHMRVRDAIAMLLLIFAGVGCSSVGGHLGGYHYFPGVSVNAAVLSGRGGSPEVLPPACSAVDMPFSLVADIAFLPYDIIVDLCTPGRARRITDSEPFYVLAAADDDGRFLRKTGTIVLSDAEMLLVVTASTSSYEQLSVSISWQEGDERHGVNMPIKQPGWFVYIETSSRVWFFDGDRLCFAERGDRTVDTGLTAEALEQCPKQVRAALPDLVQERYFP
jgi:uncharacterized protein YceK